MTAFDRLTAFLLAFENLPFTLIYGCSFQNPENRTHSMLLSFFSRSITPNWQSGQMTIVLGSKGQYLVH